MFLFGWLIVLSTLTHHVTSGQNTEAKGVAKENLKADNLRSKRQYFDYLHYLIEKHAHCADEHLAALAHKGPFNPYDMFVYPQGLSQTGGGIMDFQSMPRMPGPGPVIPPGFFNAGVPQVYSSLNPFNGNRGGGLVSFRAGTYVKSPTNCENNSCRSQAKPRLRYKGQQRSGGIKGLKERKGGKGSQSRNFNPAKNPVKVEANTTLADQQPQKDPAQQNSTHVVIVNLSGNNCTCTNFTRHTSTESLNPSPHPPHSLPTARVGSSMAEESLNPSHQPTSASSSRTEDLPTPSSPASGTPIPPSSAGSTISIADLVRLAEYLDDPHDPSSLGSPSGTNEGFEIISESLEGPQRPFSVSSNRTNVDSANAGNSSARAQVETVETLEAGVPLEAPHLPSLDSSARAKVETMEYLEAGVPLEAPQRPSLNSSARAKVDTVESLEAGVPLEVPQRPSLESSSKTKVKTAESLESPLLSARTIADFAGTGELVEQPLLPSAVSSNRTKADIERTIKSEPLRPSSISPTNPEVDFVGTGESLEKRILSSSESSTSTRVGLARTGESLDATLRPSAASSTGANVSSAGSVSSSETNVDSAKADSPPEAPVLPTSSTLTTADFTKTKESSGEPLLPSLASATRTQDGLARAEEPLLPSSASSTKTKGVGTQESGLARSGESVGAPLLPSSASSTRANVSSASSGSSSETNLDSAKTDLSPDATLPSSSSSSTVDFAKIDESLDEPPVPSFASSNISKADIERTKESKPLRPSSVSSTKPKVDFFGPGESLNAPFPPSSASTTRTQVGVARTGESLDAPFPPSSASSTKSKVDFVGTAESLGAPLPPSSASITRTQVGLAKTGESLDAPNTPTSTSSNRTQDGLARIGESLNATLPPSSASSATANVDFASVVSSSTANADSSTAGDSSNVSLSSSTSSSTTKGEPLGTDDTVSPSLSPSLVSASTAKHGLEKSPTFPDFSTRTSDEPSKIVEFVSPPLPNTSAFSSETSDELPSTDHILKSSHSSDSSTGEPLEPPLTSSDLSGTGETLKSSNSSSSDSSSGDPVNLSLNSSVSSTSAKVQELTTMRSLSPSPAQSLPKSNPLPTKEDNINPPQNLTASEEISHSIVASQDLNLTSSVNTTNIESKTKDLKRIFENLKDLHAQVLEKQLQIGALAEGINSKKLETSEPFLETSDSDYDDSTELDDENPNIATFLKNPVAEDDNSKSRHQQDSGVLIQNTTDHIVALSGPPDIILNNMSSHDFEEANHETPASPGFETSVIIDGLPGEEFLPKVNLGKVNNKLSPQSFREAARANLDEHSLSHEHFSEESVQDDRSGEVIHIPAKASNGKFESMQVRKESSSSKTDSQRQGAVRFFSISNQQESSNNQQGSVRFSIRNNQHQERVGSSISADHTNQRETDHTRTLTDSKKNLPAAARSTLNNHNSRQSLGSFREDIDAPSNNNRQNHDETLSSDSGKKQLATMGFSTDFDFEDDDKFNEPLTLETGKSKVRPNDMTGTGSQFINYMKVPQGKETYSSSQGTFAEPIVSKIYPGMKLKPKNKSRSPLSIYWHKIEPKSGTSLKSLKELRPFMSADFDDVNDDFVGVSKECTDYEDELLEESEKSKLKPCFPELFSFNTHFT